MTTNALHIRTPLGRNPRGTGYYLLKRGGGDKTLCGAQPTIYDLGFGDTRHASVREFAQCEKCRALRRNFALTASGAA